METRNRGLSGVRIDPHAEALDVLDSAVAGAAPGHRRAMIAAALQVMLRRTLGCDDLDVAYTIDPYSTATHFELRVRGAASLIMRDMHTADAVRSLLAGAHERFAVLLEGVPEEERVEEARGLTDDELRARARALRKHG